MKIRVWGCRGSLPAPGRSTVKYGGNTTCLEVRLDDNSLIIVDAGSGIRKLGRSLLKEQGVTDIHLLLTHAHWDHMMGFPFFAPAYSSYYRIHVRGGPLAKGTLQRYLEHQMEAPYFPVPFGAMRAQFDFSIGDPKTKHIGTAQVIPIRLNHPNGGYGFKIIEEGRTFVFLPDNELDFKHESGLSKEAYIEFSWGANLLFHDAQYTDEEYKFTKGWGHTTLSSATELSVQAEVQRFGLFHHDPEHTDDDIDGFVALCKKQIAQANSKVQCFAVQEGMEIIL